MPGEPEGPPLGVPTVDAPKVDVDDGEPVPVPAGVAALPVPSAVASEADAPPLHSSDVADEAGSAVGVCGAVGSGRDATSGTAAS